MFHQSLDSIQLIPFYHTLLLMIFSETFFASLVNHLSHNNKKYIIVKIFQNYIVSYQICCAIFKIHLMINQQKSYSLRSSPANKYLLFQSTKIYKYSFICILSQIYHSSYISAALVS